LILILSSVSFYEFVIFCDFLQDFILHNTQVSPTPETTANNKRKLQKIITQAAKNPKKPPALGVRSRQMLYFILPNIDLFRRII